MMTARRFRRGKCGLMAAPSGGGGGSGSRQGLFPQGCAPHSLFETSKRKPSRGASLAPAGQFTFCAAPGGREKMFRRVGLRQRRPPAAGGRRLALPHGNQGRKRVALGEPFKPGVVGDTFSFSFRCRWPSLAGLGPTHRSAPTKRWEALTFRRGRTCVSARWKGPSRDHGAAAGAGAGAMRFSTPMTAKLASAGEWSGYWKGPARAGRRPAVFTGTDSGDPRRGVSRAKSGLFFWTVHGPFSFPQDGKENGGWNGPAIIIAESHGRQVAAPTPLQGRATGGSRVWGRSSVLPLALVGLPPRRERRVFRGEGDRNFIFETGISF